MMPNMDRVELHHGDCIEVMRTLPNCSVDSIVTDPPYELGFMGKGWDSSGIAYNVQLWQQAHRVLKPGGHLLAFGGTRTWHRLAMAIEDAGFEIRDSIAWMYGSGFPKSLDVSKAIDKAAGAERSKVRIDASEVRNPRAIGNGTDGMQGGTRPWIEEALARGYHEKDSDTPATPDAQQWQGWGTALKPAFEPVVVARKPLIGTVAENVLTHGTGALNIDGSRIGTDGGGTNCTNRDKVGKCKGHDNAGRSTSGATVHGDNTTAGRWPANVILDESQAQALDAQRFFYCPKANQSERPRDGDTAHPTVKPLNLMRYLVKLVTPPGGTVLEPFAGSGTTVEAALMEGFNVIGIEITDEYLPLIVKRIKRYGEMLF